MLSRWLFAQLYKLFIWEFTKIELDTKHLHSLSSNPLRPDVKMDFMDFIVESSKLAFSDLSSQTSHTKPIIAQMCYTATIREDFPLYQRWMICDFLKRLTSTLGETIHQCNPSAQLYLHSLSRPLLRSRARFSLPNNANCCKLRNSPFLIPQRGNAAFSLLGIREIL